MIGSVVLGAVVVLFKAAFAGDDFDRELGSRVAGTVIDGLLKTTSKSDPLLQQIHHEIRQLQTATYDDAMAAGHRYLEEVRTAPAFSDERLRLARQELVAAAAAAERLEVPLLIANSEFAIAKCDALLAAPEHAEMALRRSSAALERAIEELDVSASTWRNLANAKVAQDESIGAWFERLTSGSGIINKSDIEQAERQAGQAFASLTALTELYSQVQTASLAASGADHIVVWTPPPDENFSHGLRDKAVTNCAIGTPVRGFGVTLTVERQVVWRPEGTLAVDLLLALQVAEERRFFARAKLSTAGETPETRDAASLRAADSSPWLLGKPSAPMFNVGPGRYRGWLRVEAEGEAIDMVNLRPTRLDGGRMHPTGGSFRIPVNAARTGLLRPLIT